MSTAKQLLKSAKAALDSGDPDAALSICRDVLKLDKNNYMAYVIAGVAAKKTGNATHAAQAYERAIAINENLPSAWTGLVELLSELESPSDEQLERLIYAYSTLIHLKAGPVVAVMQRKANAASRLAGTRPDLMMDAVQAWISLADETADRTLQETSRIKAVKIFLQCRGTDASTVSKMWEDTEFSVLNDALDKLSHSAVGLPLDVADVLVQRLQERQRSGIVPADETVKELLRLHGIAPGSTRCMEAVVSTTEEDGGDVVNALKLQRLAWKHMHLSIVYDGAIAAYLASSLRDRTGCDALEAAEALTGSAKAVTEMLATGNAHKNMCSSPTEALFLAAAHLEADEPRLASSVALSGLQTIGEESAKHGRKLKRMESSLRLVQGFASLATGRLESAAKHFEAVVAKPFEKYAKRGLFLVEKESRRDVESSLQALLRVDPSDPEARIEYAWMKFLSNSKIEQVDELLGAAKEAEQRRTRTYREQREAELMGPTITGDINRIEATGLMHAAQVKLAAGDKDAKELLVQAASVCPSFSLPFALLGAYFEKSQGADATIRRARKCYERALFIDPANELAGRRIIALAKTDAEKKEAYRYASRGAESDPRAVWALAHIGEAQLQQGHPNDATRSLQLACRSFEQRSARERESVFYGAVDLLPSAQDEKETMAMEILSRGEGDCEEKDLFQAMLLDAEVGVILTKLGECREAVEAFSRATSWAAASDRELPATVYSAQGEALYNWAEVEWKEGSWDFAVTLWRRTEQSFVYAAGKAAAAVLWKRAGDAARRQAEALVALNRNPQQVRQRMIAWYNRALKLKPWERSLFGDLGVSLEGRDKQEDTAIRLATSAVDASPEKFELWVSLGSLFLRGNRPNFSSASYCMTTAVELEQKAVVYEALGSLFATVKDRRSEAAACAFEALRLDPTSARGWLLIGALRECDADKSEEKLRSAIHAYNQSDLLGGGPEAVRGLQRTLTDVLTCEFGSESDLFAAVVAYSRLGIDEFPHHVKQSIERACHRRREEATAATGVKFRHLYPDLVLT